MRLLYRFLLSCSFIIITAAAHSSHGHGLSPAFLKVTHNNPFAKASSSRSRITWTNIKGTITEDDDETGTSLPSFSLFNSYRRHINGLQSVSPYCTYKVSCNAHKYILHRVIRI